MKASDLLKQEIQKHPYKIIVLDDDPTGIQTVHGVSVYTDLTEESVKKGFEEENNLFYILTNSRGMTEEQTSRLHHELGTAICKAAKQTGKKYFIISRSDSTLRGHYPLETRCLEQVFKDHNMTVDGEIICPFFKEGGRVTIDNIHYVKMDEKLVPAADTEFAKDKTFGYHSSDLTEYIEEKTKGQYRKENVICISLKEIRACEIGKITEKLCKAEGFQKIVVNAENENDIYIFCIALYRAFSKGKYYLFRTAASFVKIVGGIDSKPLLTSEELLEAESKHGGLIVIGSHTEKTTKQMLKLIECGKLEFIEFNSDLVVRESAFEMEINRVSQLCGMLLKKGKSAVIYTKRKELMREGDTKESALLRSVKISDGVQRIVAGIAEKPSFIIAKGGITSNDIGVKALKVKKACAAGQIQPGVPVWITGEESRFPGIPFVIFPGNVGDDNTLLAVVRILLQRS